MADEVLPAPRVGYVLPLRWTSADAARTADLAAYFRWLRGRAEVIVVDGSPDPLFAAHQQAWGSLCLHVRPDSDLAYRNGKVNGVITGIRRTGCEKVVIADDDVRYDQPGLDRISTLLDHVELVRPQNYFDPTPWHACWDTARCLLNRAVGRDYPGTFGLRRAHFLAMGGYDGDVLFENLELIRTVRAAGGREASPLDLYVRRRPPSTAQFVDQRVRQAYDDLAQPWRLALALPVLPLTASAVLRGRPGRLLAAALGAVAVAERGRRRAGGTRVYPAVAPLYAPLWVLERGICSWLAVGFRVGAGGVRYGGSRIRIAAHSPRALRRGQPRRPGAGIRG